MKQAVFDTLAVVSFLYGAAWADAEPFGQAVMMATLFIGLAFVFGWLGGRVDRKERSGRRE